MLSPRPGDSLEIAVLTPRVYNSVYFGHSYLAPQMGAYLAEGCDLVVRDDDCVYLKTVEGLTRLAECDEDSMAGKIHLDLKD